MLYIVAAMEDELLGLRRELDALGASQGVGFPLEFHLVGVGPPQAGEAMAAAIVNGRRRPQGVLMLGVAGAVEPGRETGELVLSGSYLRQQNVDSRFRGNDGAGGSDGVSESDGASGNDGASGSDGADSAVEPAEAIAPDPTLLAVAESAAVEARMPVYRSNSLTVDHLISEGWERQQLRERYGVGTVNMEDHAVAAAAQAEGVPFLSVRVILDTAEQRLPGYLPKLYRSRNALFGEVLLRPWRIPTLRRLKAQMELCRSVLAQFGLSFIHQEAERRRSVREKESADAIY